MPRVPIIQSQTSVPTVDTAPADPNVGAPIVNAIGGFADRMEHAVLAQQYQAERERKIQQEHQQLDEARVYTINSASDVQMKAQQHLDSDAESGSLAGSTDRLLKNFDTWTQDAVNAAPDKAKPMVQQHLAELRAAYNMKAYGLETAARRQGLSTDYLDGLESDKRLVWADPQQFPMALARRQALADVLNLPDDKKSALAKTARESLALEAALGQTERDPDGVLTKLGFPPGKWLPGQPLPDVGPAIEAVKRDPIFSNLPTDKLEGVLHRALSLSASRDAANKAASDKALTEASKAVETLSGFVLEGRLPSPDYQRQVMTQVGPFPELKKSASELFSQSVSGAAFGSQTLPQQQSTLRAIDAKARHRWHDPGRAADDRAGPDDQQDPGRGLQGKPVGRRRPLPSSATDEGDDLHRGRCRAATGRPAAAADGFGGGGGRAAGLAPAAERGGAVRLHAQGPAAGAPGRDARAGRLDAEPAARSSPGGPTGQDVQAACLGAEAATRPHHRR
jgi:hypothetical protein